jgi:hypothetical protein
MRMVVVGGVPGAGKSTALRAYADDPGVLVLDPDPIRDRLHWRPLVHAVHQVLVWLLVLAGPGYRPLLVHDTATRPRRRGALLRLASWRGWDVTLLLLDVTRADALTGQVRRGRLVSAPAFDRHWRRWVRLRAHPVTGYRTVLVDRDTVAGVLDELTSAGAESRELTA